MAQVLNVALSGPRSYNGQMQDLPFVHGTGRREIGPAEIDAAVVVLWRTWAILVVAIALIALV